MNIDVDISIDFLWGDKHFTKKEWDGITYIVGARDYPNEQPFVPKRRCLQDTVSKSILILFRLHLHELHDSF